MTHLVGEVRRRCRQAGLEPPSRSTVERRVAQRAPSEVLARRKGRKAARDRFMPATGSVEAPWLHLCKSTTLWSTLSSSIGYSPSCAAAAVDPGDRCPFTMRCRLPLVARPAFRDISCTVCGAGLPAEGCLARRTGIEGEWLVRGLLDRLHLDNAKEFHSEALRRGCEQYGITIDYRPVRTPHYGGHIERLIGTMMGKVHLLPGDNGFSACSSGNRIFGASIAAKRMRNSTIYRTKSTLQRAFLRISEN